MPVFLVVIINFAIALLANSFGFGGLKTFLICILPVTFLIGFALEAIPRIIILITGVSTAFIIGKIAILAGNSPVFPAIAFFLVGSLVSFFAVSSHLGYNPFTTNAKKHEQAEKDAAEASHEASVQEYLSDPSRDVLGPMLFDEVDPEEVAEDLMYLVALRLITPDVFKRCAAHVPKLGPKLVTADTANLRAKGAEFDESDATAAVVNIGEIGLLTENEQAAIFDAIENYQQQTKPVPSAEPREQANPKGQSFDPEKDIHDSHLFRLAGTRMISIDVFLRAMLVFNPAYEAWRATIENFPEEQIHKGDANDAAELLRAGLITTPEFMEAMKIYDIKMKQAAT